MALIIDLNNDTTFYDSVRRLLGGVDEDILPNEDISDPAILDVAEFQVIDLVPNFTELSDTDRAKVRLATVHVMASLLCPSMPNRIDVEVRTIDVTWKRKPVDYSELEVSLLAKANGLLENLLAASEGSGNIFAIAPSKRAVTEREES